MVDGCVILMWMGFCRNVFVMWLIFGGIVVEKKSVWWVNGVSLKICFMFGIKFILSIWFVLLIIMNWMLDRRMCLCLKWFNSCLGVIMRILILWLSKCFWFLNDILLMSKVMVNLWFLLYFLKFFEICVVNFCVGVKII